MLPHIGKPIKHIEYNDTSNEKSMGEILLVWTEKEKNGGEGLFFLIPVESERSGVEGEAALNGMNEALKKKK